jgi:hypothetical protein
MRFSGSNGNNIILQVEPSGAVNFVGTTGSILKIMDNLSGSLFSVNNISGLSILEVLSNNQVKLGNPTNYALVISGSNVIITGSLIDKGTGIKFLVVDTATGVVHTTGSGGGGGGSPTTPASPVNSIQYNNAGAFGGVPTLAYSSSFGLIATGSFTGSFTGSLLGTASWAQSASQAVTASHIRVTSTNTGTLTVDLTTPGEVKLTAFTSSTSPAGTSMELQYSAGGGLFGAVASSSYNNGSSQLTLGKAIVTGSLFGTASWAASASQAITSSYVNIQAGPRIQAVNYNASSGVTTITGSIGGSDTHIQFNSGSEFSGSTNFTYNYTSNILNLTSSVYAHRTVTQKFYSTLGVLNQSGSPEPKSSLNNMSSTAHNGGFVYTYFRDNNQGGYYPVGFNLFTNITGSNNSTNSTSKDFDTHFAIRTYAIDPFKPVYLSSSGKIWETQSMADITFGDLTQPTTFGLYYATSSVREPAFAVYGRSNKTPNSQYSFGPFSSSLAVWADGKTIIGLKAIPPLTDLSPTHNVLEVRGSILITGSTYTTASAQGFTDNTAMYFGSPGVVGSWRIILSGSGNGSTLNIERWNSTTNTYGKDAVFISGSVIEL